MTLLDAPVSVDDHAAATGLPRVSCIMPTRDRRPFVDQAIRYFLRQDYPDTELVIVDDGFDAVGDLVPDDPRFVYVRLDGTHSIGTKRNVACERATGEVIAHWDDDDWFARRRLRTQVSALLRDDSDICGLTEVLHYRMLRGDAWLYSAPSGGTTALAGCSLVYRRSAWREHPFGDTNVGEDSAFVASHSASKVTRLPDRDLLVAIVHDRNVSPLPLGTPQWTLASLDDVATTIGEDRSFYTVLRGGPPGPPVSRAPRPEITVAAAYNIYTGYGTTAEYFALSLARAGASVRALPLGLAPEGLTDELIGMTRVPPFGDESPLIYYSWINPDFETVRAHRNLFISTMWEADRLPAEWIGGLNEAKAIIVPSTFVADTCLSSGVERPISIVPLGADPDLYHWRRREEREGITTLILAPVDGRKHTLLAIAAWKAAFAGDPDARLIIKTSYGYHNYTPDDPRISYIDRVDATRGLGSLYGQADVLLALGNEGFGLPMVEGMSTGLPVIALDAEGQADACRDARGLVLPVPGVGFEQHQPGSRRSIPDGKIVENHLRWVNTHRREAAELGRTASQWVAANRNIWSVGPRLLDVVGRSNESVRRRLAPRTFWTTSAGTPCGIAAYTDRLRRNLPGVGMSATEPESSGPAIVHLQHHQSIVDDARVDRFVNQARERKVTTAVTLHSVSTVPRPWERRSHALVATTSAAAARLRERHPGAKVTHIPLGCETWEYPRKTTRGRTIGFFGFPGHGKGLARLALAARELRGCEVVMYGYSAPSDVVRWPTDLAVERHPGWLPLPEIAADLAARADVLVFHYDAVDEYSASSAVLLGLSTGVPVITSDTPWFEDLGAAVYRAGRGTADLVAGLERLFDDDALRDRTTTAARAYCADNSWSRIAARHVDLWNSLTNV